MPDHAFPVGRVVDAPPQWREVVLLGGHLDVGQHPPAQQGGDLERVDPVVLGLAPVDGLPVQGVAPHEVHPFGRAQVRQPAPGEDALDGHDEALAVGGHDLEEGLRRGPEVLVDENLALGVEDADVHRSGVQSDPAPVPVRAAGESHRSPSCADARWLDASSLRRVA